MKYSMHEYLPSAWLKRCISKNKYRNLNSATL